MAAKNCFLSAKNDKNHMAVNSVTSNHDNQYINLNLNQAHNGTENASLQFKNNSIHGATRNDDYNFDDTAYVKARNDTKSWEKFDNDLCSKASEYLNRHDLSKNNFTQSNNDHSNVTSSTLSLHIIAYENSIEAVETADVSNNPTQKQHGLGNQQNQILFEFPRQQENTTSKPEIMQFKASQKLLNPSDYGTTTMDKKDADEKSEESSDDELSLRKVLPTRSVHYSSMRLKASSLTPKTSESQPSAFQMQDSHSDDYGNISEEQRTLNGEIPDETIQDAENQSLSDSDISCDFTTIAPLSLKTIKNVRRFVSAKSSLPLDQYNSPKTFEK